MIIKIKNSLSQIRKSKLFNDSWRTIALQATVRIISFVGSVYAIRCLGPTELGIAAFILAMTSQFTLIGDLGLNITGVRSIGNNFHLKDEIISTVWGIRLRISIILTIIILIVLISLQVDNIYLWLIALPVVSLSILTPNWIYQAIEKIPEYNIIQNGQALVLTFIYLFFFYEGIQAKYYLIANIFGALLTFLVSYYYLIKKHKINIKWFAFDFRKSLEMVKGSLYALGLNIMIFLYTSLEIPLITFFVNEKQTGIYRSAQSFVSIAAPILSTAGVLFYPRLISWKNESTQIFENKSKTALKYLLSLFLVGGLLSFFIIPSIFKIIFGDQFSEAAIPSNILLLSKGFILCGIIPSWGLLALNKESTLLKITAIVAFLSIIINLIFIPLFGIVAAAITNLISEFLIFILSFILFNKLLKQSRIMI